MLKENRLSLKRLFWDYDFSEKELLSDAVIGRIHSNDLKNKYAVAKRILFQFHRFSDDLHCFVNDVPYRSGGTESFDLFPRVDGWWNILSNNITALARREPKDVADIVFLCRRYHFTWQNVFAQAARKTTYVDPLDISVVLSEFPREFFSRVQSIDDVSLDDVFRDLQIVAKDILQRKANTLASAV